MNPLEVILLLVLIVLAAKYLNNRKHQRHSLVERDLDRDDHGTPDGDTARLREEVLQLKQRIQVLERIAVDKENSIAREIEQLRDR